MNVDKENVSKAVKTIEENVMVGQRLRACRKDKGYKTIESLVDAIEKLEIDEVKKSGTSVIHLGEVERGKRRLTEKLAKCCSLVLGVSERYLFCLSDYETEEAEFFATIEERAEAFRIQGELEKKIREIIETIWSIEGITIEPVKRDAIHDFDGISVKEFLLMTGQQDSEVWCVIKKYDKAIAWCSAGEVSSMVRRSFDTVLDSMNEFIGNQNNRINDFLRYKAMIDKTACKED